MLQLEAILGIVKSNTFMVEETEAQKEYVTILPRGLTGETI